VPEWVGITVSVEHGVSLAVGLVEGFSEPGVLEETG
jgi:hypothetical protein